VSNPTLTEVHNAILGALTKKMTDVSVLPAYPDLLRSIKALPAVLIELSELEPGDDPGTGETALIGHFSARAIVDPNAVDAHMTVRELAARLAVAVDHENWGLDIGLARLVQVGEDGFLPELDGYLVWMVEWTHRFNQGEPT